MPARAAFRPGEAGHPVAMPPHTYDQPDHPTRPLPIAQVSTGMSVADAAGEELGEVTTVEMPGTSARPEAPDDDIDQLMADGYFRIESGGLRSQARYATGAQIAEVTTTDQAGIITLTVSKDQLYSTT
jgi:hypothetical protein